MVWENSNQNGGFSTATKTWLPVAHAHLNKAPSEAEQNPGALIHHYRRAIAFRHAHPVLRKGDMVNVRVEGTALRFERTLDDGTTLHFRFNMSGDPVVIDMPDGDWHSVGGELNSAAPMADNKLHLGPWQPCLLLGKA